MVHFFKIMAGYVVQTLNLNSFSFRFIANTRRSFSPDRMDDGWPGRNWKEDRCGEKADAATRGPKKRDHEKKGQPLKFNAIDSQQKCN